MPEEVEKQLKPNGTDTTTTATTKNNAEASEDDPCIDDSKNPRKKRWEKCRDGICEKTELTHKNFFYVAGIAAGCLLLLIVVIALAATWPHLSHSYKYPICKESSCIRAASQIRESMNSFSSPCSDLWNWTCGGWLKKYPLPKDRSIWNQKEQLMKKEYERIRDQIATLKPPLHTSSVEWKLKYLYEACMDVDNINNDKEKPLMNIISELGGWYILRNWNDADFDKNTLLLKLHVKWGVSPYFKITVEPNPRIPGQNSIRISPSGLGLPDREYYYTETENRIQIAYKKLIRDVIIYLNSATNEATKFGTDIFSYEKRIAEITPDSTTLQNPIDTYNPISLSELKDTVQIPLFDILTAMYPDSNVTENTEVIATSQEYLNQISQIISTTDKTTMNGYLIWTLVRSYLPYLSTDFTSAVDTFNSELYGIQTPMERWEFCTKITKKFMGLASDVFHEIDNPLEEKSISVVNETFHSILGVVKDRVNSLQRFPVLQQQLRLKLNQIGLQLGLPEKIKTRDYLKEYYLKLMVYKIYWFQTINHGINFLKSLEERRLKEAPPEDYVTLQSISGEPSTVSYFPSKNVVFIPRALLSKPFFEDSFPRSVIYGRLGVEIANAILTSILPFDSLWTVDRKILTPFHKTVNESVDTVEGTVNCLSNYILNLNLDVPAARANATALRIVKHLNAVSVANEALLKSLENEPHTHQPALEEFEDSALFFLSYAQTQCSETTNQQQFYENTVNFGLSQKTLLHLIWAQLPTFTKAFDCDFSKKTKCRDIF